MSMTLKGWVFVVEDEAMISMMVEDMLVELGYGIAATASKVDQALRLAQTASFDVAILDVNVNGQMVFPVAEAIKTRKLPFLFATGYGIAGVPEEYRDCLRLQKPYRIEELGMTIDQARSLCR
jgi:CheY-like chemotaxis protein